MGFGPSVSGMARSSISEDGIDPVLRFDEEPPAVATTTAEDWIMAVDGGDFRCVPTIVEAVQNWVFDVVADRICLGPGNAITNVSDKVLGGWARLRAVVAMAVRHQMVVSIFLGVL